MIRLVRAEWTKLFTTKVWLGLLLGACVMAGGFAALFTGLAGQERDGQEGIAPVGTQQY
jgi:ABC-2 type transport system permease protein